MLHMAQSPLTSPVSEDQLNAVVDAAFGVGTTMQRWQPLTGGLFNTSYDVTLSGSGERVIIRIAPDRATHGDVLFDYEQRMMAAEPVALDLMRAAGVPVPEVLAVDTSGAIIARDYMILRALDAVPLTDESVPEAAKPALRRALGAAVRQIHQIAGSGFGWPDANGAANGKLWRGGTWSDVFGGLVTEACQRARACGALTEAITREAEQVFAAHRSIFDDGVVPALVHNDLWDANVLVWQRDGAWAIAAIIDADRALFADREFEPATWGRDPDFAGGYAWPLDPSPKAALRRLFYVLFQHLFHAFVFKCQIPLADHYRHHPPGVADTLAAIRAAAS